MSDPFTLQLTVLESFSPDTVRFFSSFLETYPIARTIGNLLGIILPFTLLIAFSGLCCMSAVAQRLAISRERSCYAKASRQISVLGTILGFILILGSVLLLFYFRSAAADYPLLYNARLWSTIVLATGTICIALHCFFWNALKKIPFLHLLLALLATILGYLGTYALLAVLATESQVFSEGLVLPSGYQELFIAGADSPLWINLFFLPPLSLPLSGCV